MKNVFLSWACAAALICLATVTAFAQTTVGVTPVPATTVVIPYGDWVSQTIGALQTVLPIALAAIVAWLLRFVPASLQVFVNKATTDQVDQLLTMALNYGFNSLDSALKGKELTVDAKNAILSQALNYAISHGPEALINWMGGENAIMQKLIARFDKVAVPAATTTMVNSVTPIAAP